MNRLFLLCCSFLILISAPQNKIISSETTLRFQHSDSSKQSDSKNEDKTKQDVNPEEVWKNKLKKKIDDLTKQIESDSLSDRTTAIKEIYAMRERTTLPLVLKALKDENTNIRYYAIYCLIVMYDKEVFPYMVEALQDKDSMIRWTIMEHLKEHKLVEYIPQYLELLTAEKDILSSGNYYKSVVDALSNIGKPAFKPVMEALSSDNVDLKYYACKVLGRLGMKEAVPALLEAIDFEPDGSSLSLNDVREGAIEALGELRTKSAIPKLVMFLNDNRRKLSITAANALGKIGSDNAITALINKYNEDKNNNIRLLEILSKTKNKRALKLILSALDSDNQIIQYTAVRAIIAFEEESTVPVLVSLLDNKDLPRILIIDALIKLKYKGIVKYIRDVFLTTESIYSKYDLSTYLIHYNATSGLEEKILNTFTKHVEENTPEFMPEQLMREFNYFKIFGDNSIPYLLKCLKSDKHYVRINAARLLGDFQGDDVVKALLSLLSDENEDVRISAIKSLGLIGDDSIVPDLYFLLEKAEYKVTHDFANALFQIGGKNAIVTLEKLFDKCEDKSTKLFTADKLVRLYSDRSKEMYYFVLDSLNDFDSQQRRFAIWMLGSIGDNKAIPRLIDVLKRRNFTNTGIILQSLSQIGDKSVIPSLMEILNDKNFSEYKNTFLQYPLAQGVVDVSNYIEMIKDEDETVMRKAYEILLQYKDKGIDKYFIDALKSDSEAEIIAGLNGIGKLENDKYLLNILKFTKHENSNIREAAIFAIGKLSGVDDAAVLISALQDKEDNVRQSAAMAIGRNKIESAKETLSEKFDIEINPNVKVALAFALIKIGSDEDGAKLGYITDCATKSWNEYKNCAKFLVEIGDKKAVPALKKALNHHDISYKIDVAYALADIKDESAIPAMIDAYNNSVTFLSRDSKTCFAIALANIGYDKAVDLLITELKSTSNFSREEAAIRLGILGNKSAVESLQKIVDSDYCYRVIEAARNAIKNINGK